MQPVAHAAALQKSRTLNSSWRNSNQALIHSGSMQLQSPPRKGGQAVFPSWQQPVSALLSSQTSSKFQQLPQEMLSAKLRPSGSRIHDQSFVPDTLRDRVACTRYLSKTLRNECLERLDQIVVPRKMCQRPSWTHLEHSMSVVPDESVERSVIADELEDALPGALISESSDLVHPSEEYGHEEVVVGLAVEDEQTERMAALNFLRDFHATPAIVPESVKPAMQAELLSPLNKSKGRRRREMQGHLQEEPRYLKLWTMDDCDLTASAAVWRSTAQGNAVSSNAGNKAAGSPLMAGNARTRGAAASPVSATALHKRNIHVARRAIEAARSEAQLPVPHEEHMHAAAHAGSEVGPTARGVTSMLRSSLRYILQP